jgi:hypothetical protein
MSTSQSTLLNSYSCRASILDKLTEYRLEGDSLIVTPSEGTAERFLLSEVRDVHLLYVKSKYSRAWFCELMFSSRKVRFKSRHFKGLANFEDRNAEYSAFVRSIHRALEPYRHQVKFHSGSLGAYIATLVLTLIGAVATLFCLIVALWQGAIPFGIVTFVAFSSLSRLKPRVYSPESIPADMLPA